MTRRRRAMALGGLLALALLCGAPSPRAAGADEGPEGEGRKATPKSVQAAFGDAFLEGDAHAMALAAEADVDPYAVVRRFLVQDLSNGAKALGEKGPFFAARAYVARVGGRASAEGLREVLDAWEALSPDERMVERRLAIASSAARAAEAKADWTTSVATAEGAAEDLARAADSPFGASLSLAWGRSLAELGREEASLGRFQEAASRCERLRWSRGRNVAWAGIAWAHYRAGRMEPAASAYETWLSLGPPDDDFAQRARVRLARAYVRTGRTSQALEQVETARAAALAAGHRRAAALALGVRSDARFAEGRVADALSDAEAAEAEARAAGDAAEGSRNAVARAEILAWLGRYAESLEVLEATLEDCARRNDHAGEGWALRVLGGLRLSLGSEGAALDAFARSARAYGKAEETRGRAHALFDRGRTLVSLGRHDAARADLEQALAAFEATGDRAATVLPRAYLGRVAVASGRLGDARALLHRAREDVGTGSPFERATVDHFLGGLAEARGDLDAAAQAYEDAIRGKEESGGAGAAAPWLASARLALRRGDRAACLATVRRALERRAGLPRGLSDDDVLESRSVDRDLCDLGFLAAWAPSGAGPAPADALAAAFGLAELGRARLLSRALASAAAPDPTAAHSPLEREAGRARATLEAARSRLGALASATPRDAALLERARSALDAAHAAEREARARAVRAAARDARLVGADPIDLVSTAARLPAGSALVLYHVAGERLHAIAVTPERTRGVDLGPWKPVADAVAGYLRLASTPEGPEAALSRRLHAALVAPLAGDLATASRLIVVPDASLAFLPFEALLDASERPRRLVEAVEVVYAPSATAYDLLRAGAARRGRGLLALGDPTFPAEAAASAPRPLALLRGAEPLARLPASGGEVRDIASLFPAEERTVLLRDAATLEGLTRALAARREPLAALHVACHGLLDAEHSALSGLALSGGALWTADDVARARIPADLAVLSACETAGGALVAGEGVVGLVRAFFYAGVPRVVVSDWAVSDAGTATFMRRTYEGIVRQGLAPAAALAAAKREAIAAGGAAAHPSRWAPFVLWGLAE